MSGSREGADIVMQTIISNVKVPNVTKASRKAFIELKRKTDDYEKQLAEKNKETETNVTHLSLRASMEDIDIQVFIAAG